ncbi:MAG: 7-cyano-7-deazaguanine synthase, partial [Clostridia bacterium]|nr:7-cyano-7-deazaguanine synthase [Clostridia bacterium]
MEKVIIIRYAEIHLKGKNRGYFERVFSVNLERALKGIRHELHRTSGRYLVAGFPEEREAEIMDRISCVFGVHSYSSGLVVPSDMGHIYEAVKTVAPQSGTFKVDTHRADKKYPLTSMQINAEIGGRLLSDFKGLKVDVHEPQSYVYIDVRENGTALVFGKFLEGAGGMPVGTSGKGLLLISGGIDSPVAGYMLAKRGMTVEYLHFHSYPYTNEQAKEKVVELARELSRYAGTMKITTVSVTHIQEEIHAKCAAELNETLLRRFMSVSYTN